MNYPNASKKAVNVKNVSSSSNRGMSLEEDINQTNDYYRDSDIAVIYKKPTPIQIVHVDYPKRSAAKITEAYFRDPSTTDYNGIYKGRYLDFEAKESHKSFSLPFQMFHPHQIVHLERVIRHGAIAFGILRFTELNETYLVPADKLIDYYHHADRKSWPVDWVKENGHLIPYSYIKPCDYLSVVDQVYSL